MTTRNYISFDEVLNEYDAFHSKTERTPKYDLPINVRGLHGAIGLNGESGEVLELYKKRLFGKQVELDKERLKEEIGDVFYYFWLIMDAEDIDFKEVLMKNVKKLKERYNV